MGLYSTIATYLASKEIEIGEKTQNKCYYAFKVIQGHPRSSRSVPIESPYATSYLWLIVTDILSHTVSEISQLIKFRHCVFESPFGGLGTTYDVHLGLIGKRAVDFLLLIIELFSLDVTAEALRAKIDRKLAISLQRGQFDTKFQVEGGVPHQSFLHG